MSNKKYFDQESEGENENKNSSMLQNFQQSGNLEKIFFPIFKWTTSGDSVPAYQNNSVITIMGLQANSFEGYQARKAIAKGEAKEHLNFNKEQSMLFQLAEDIFLFLEGKVEYSEIREPLVSRIDGEKWRHRDREANDPDLQELWHWERFQKLAEAVNKASESGDDSYSKAMKNIIKRNLSELTVDGNRSTNYQILKKDINENSIRKTVDIFLHNEENEDAIRAFKKHIEKHIEEDKLFSSLIDLQKYREDFEPPKKPEKKPDEKCSIM